jgi:uncharacterized protein (DUF58 family)
VTRDQATLRSAISDLQLHAQRIVEGLRAGGHASKRAGASVEFDRYRAYQPGDDLRHLDWRVFARSERLVLKRSQLETTLDVMLLMDASGSMSFGSGGDWGTKYDLVSSIAQAIAWLATESGDRIAAFRCADSTLDSCALRSGPVGLAQALRVIDSPAMNGQKVHLAEAASHIVSLTHRSGLVVVLSDLLDPPERFAQAIGKLRHHGHDVLVIQVLDNAERTFDVSEEVRLEDLEGGVSRRLNARVVRDDYLEALNQHQKSILASCRSLHVDHVLVDPHESPIPMLRAVIQRRNSPRQTG